MIHPIPSTAVVHVMSHEKDWHFPASYMHGVRYRVFTDPDGWTLWCTAPPPHNINDLLLITNPDMQTVVEFASPRHLSDPERRITCTSFTASLDSLRDGWIALTPVGRAQVPDSIQRILNTYPTLVL